jgi:hypothetical protein
MERDEVDLVLGSTRLPGPQQSHPSGDAARDAGSLVGRNDGGGFALSHFCF